MDFFTFWPNDISDQNYQKDRFIGILFRISYSNMLSSRNLKNYVSIIYKEMCWFNACKKVSIKFFKNYYQTDASKTVWLKHSLRKIF